MPNSGWIKLYRSLLESDIYHSNPCTRELFIYLLLKAQHSDHKNLKEGQVFFKATDFINDTAWYAGFKKLTYKKWDVTKSIRKLHESNSITVMKATHGTIVTICNYNRFQGSDDHESNSKPTTKATRKQLTAININKNVKNEEYINNKLLIANEPLAGTDEKSLEIIEHFLIFLYTVVINYISESKSPHNRELIDQFLEYLKPFNNGITPVDASKERQRQAAWTILSQLGVRSGMQSGKLPPEVRGNIKAFFDWLKKEKASKNLTIEKMYTLRVQVNNFITNHYNVVKVPYIR